MKQKRLSLRGERKLRRFLREFCDGLWASDMLEVREMAQDLDQECSRLFPRWKPREQDPSVEAEDEERLDA